MHRGVVYEVWCMRCECIEVVVLMCGCACVVVLMWIVSDIEVLINGVSCFDQLVLLCSSSLQTRQSTLPELLKDRVATGGTVLSYTY